VADERGVATVEWTALVLCVALALGAALALGPKVDGRSFGGLLAHAITCAARGGCDDGDEELAAAYGTDDAELVRRFAPGLVYEAGTTTLPVDWRECRAHRCSDAPDDPDLDAHRAVRGDGRATAFTRVVRSGDEVFIQYWLYYPDSTTTTLNAAGAWRRARPVARALAPRVPSAGLLDRPYPGAHRDDWESYQVRISADGRALARASSHHGYQTCKGRRCADTWAAPTGWTRVSRGSHAGHLPPRRDLEERTTTAPALRLVPTERLDRRGYRPLDPGITPPWRKRVYRHPRSDSTS
jgi:hypothetical protein